MDGRCLCAFLLLAILQLSSSTAVARTVVTNEDIRDAILSVVRIIRSSEDKLERHEFRERALGEQLKKGLVTIDKRLKLLDPVKGTMSRLDERLATVETILMQKDERERIQLQKTFVTVEDIQTNLPIIVEKLKNDILEKIALPQTKSGQGDLSKSDLTKVQEDLGGKLNNITKLVKDMQEELSAIKTENKNLKEMNNKSSENLEKVKRQLDSSEQLLEKYENKLAEYNNRLPNELIPANYKEQNAWQGNFLQALEVQKTNVEQILSDVKAVGSKISKLPDKTYFEGNQNATLDALEDVKDVSVRQSDKVTGMLNNKFKELASDNDKKHDVLIKSFNEMGEMIESLTENIATSYEQLRKEIQSLSKVEQVMVQTADSVLDTKRRVEYGVHQILLEVGDLVKMQGKDINATINERFDSFELSVLDEDSGALANLTSKIGQEIDQVWRQIGIMHQQMSASTDTLNKLQNQTDAYVNGSLNVMDSMKGKVGKITSRMSEVDDNLNYLLGRLSLVTQEFNQIKSGLGNALDQIRSSFLAVQDKIKDAGPGPHKISSNEIVDTK